MPKNIIPHGIYFHVHSTGWMDGEGMKLWLEKMWSKRPGGLLKKPSLLVRDQFKVHVTESTKRLASKLKTHLAVFPDGSNSQLQLLDVSVNKPFKGFMHDERAKWIEAPTNHVTPAERVKRPSISNVGHWVKNSWQRIKSETSIKSLKNCGISKSLDGSEDVISYEESDASSENNHEDDFSGSD